MKKMRIMKDKYTSSGLTKEMIADELSGCTMVRTDVPLKDYTSFRIGGPADVFAEPQDEESLYEAMKKMAALDREDREAMGLAGRAHMEKVFDKKKVVEETLSCLL